MLMAPRFPTIVGLETARGLSGVERPRADQLHLLGDRRLARSQHATSRKARRPRDGNRAEGSVAGGRTCDTGVHETDAPRRAWRRQPAALASVHRARSRCASQFFTAKPSVTPKPALAISSSSLP